MCGIAGIIGLNPALPEIDAMLLSQQHRGPDAKIIRSLKNAFLGHNRLSIIDLSDAANQPMTSNCGRYVIVFNGEIYNYKELRSELVHEYEFKNASDTEVLLAAFIKWKSAALERCNGMFSFAIWDIEAQQLFAARDRFGVKPFYYAIHNNHFYFSSEIKAFFAAGIKKQKNSKVWANYYCYGTYGLPNETFWRNINQLPAGHFLEVDGAGKMIRIEKWYDFPTRIAQIHAMPDAVLREKYESLLADAIQLRFRADVPLGMNVSGGLDSSLLIALVNEQLNSEKSIEAFTFYSDNTTYDELPWVIELMKTTTYPLNKVLFSAVDIPQLIEKVSYHQDEPFGGFPTLAYSQLFKAARKENIPVILDGQGMDEAWAGYDYYHNDSNQIIQGVVTSPVRPEAITEEFRQFSRKEMYEMPFQSHLQNLQYRDLFYTKIPRALRFNDRISMMHGTELREPFLDYRLVELAFAQSDAMKMQNGQTKWLLRDLAQKHLGKQIALAPKRPLQTPQREWLSGELKDYANEQIARFSSFDFVNKKEVQAIWTAYCNGNQDNSFYIWQWINSAVL
ncbi:MAG: asparagine synthase (glutamine-hydrolyzing) [Flavobacterium sp.]|nr:asparagine synthase (glutamine-hydrolyzing) [Flavobacterium sp.]